MFQSINLSTFTFITDVLYLDLNQELWYFTDYRSDYTDRVMKLASKPGFDTETG